MKWPDPFDRRIPAGWSFLLLWAYILALVAVVALYSVLLSTLPVVGFAVFVVTVVTITWRAGRKLS